MSQTALGLHLEARTEPFSAADSLLEFADPHDALFWGRGDDVLIGWGQSVRLNFHGPDRFATAAAQWRELVAAASVWDTVGLPGSGLIAWGSFSFADDSDQSSVLVVPQFVWGRRGGRGFFTQIRISGAPIEVPPRRVPVGEHARIDWEPASDAAQYRERVADAIRQIRAGRLEKVVLSRAVHGELAPGSDVRLALRRLRERFVDTWVFSVDGLVGASPETLVAVHEGSAEVRVLAGTLDASTGGAALLEQSEKDQLEHRFAVENVSASLELAGIGAELAGPPYALELPELWHLASDLRLDVPERGLWDILAALHPTAAIAGTPTDVALEVIRELESGDRGRYAGPVGWIDADGNGEWAIALRCAHITGSRVRANAGGGIVASSDPALEFAETELKLRAVKSAFRE